MDALVEKLNARLLQWKPEAAAEARERIAEVIELADHDVLDLAKSRAVDQKSSIYWITDLLNKAQRTAVSSAAPSGAHLHDSSLPRRARAGADGAPVSRDRKRLPGPSRTVYLRAPIRRQYCPFPRPSTAAGALHVIPHTISAEFPSPRDHETEVPHTAFRSCLEVPRPNLDQPHNHAALP